MTEKFTAQFDALLEKYSELLLGSSEEELQEKVRYWALYTQVSKTMPALVKHWNQLYPDGKQEMMQLITEIKQLNEAQRNKSAK